MSHARDSRCLATRADGARPTPAEQRRRGPFSALVALALIALAAAGATGCDDMRVEPDPPRDARATDASAQDDVASGDDAASDDASTGDVAANDAPAGDTASHPDAGAACVPNRDGMLTRAEVPYVLGATVLYAVNRDGTTVDGIDTAGTTTSTGRVWDLSAARPDDHRVLDEVVAPSGQWWAAQYPTATFALPLENSDTLLGVYRESDTALELLGTVSRETNRTSLVMNPPVIVVRFPLTEGASWTQMVTASGVYNFTPLTNVTQYSSRVDAHGEVWTPAGRFPALRLRTDLDQTVPLTVLHRTARAYVFLTECWGLAARITSVDNETATEFTRAAEYRRLTL